MARKRIALHRVLAFLLLHLIPMSSSHRGAAFAPSILLRHPHIRHFSSSGAPAKMSAQDPSQKMHLVSGLQCTEVAISLQMNKKAIDVTVLEASSASQETLVDAALVLDDDEQPSASLTLKSGDPYGAVLWPASAAVAEYLLGDHAAHTLENQTLLEVGAGNGLLSLAAAIAGYKRVIATDYESIPLDFLTFAASAAVNAHVPSGVIETSLLDVCDHATPLPAADIVVAADVLYLPATGVALAHRVVESLERGSRVVVGDSPDRPGRPAFIAQLGVLVPGLKVEFVGVEASSCTGHRHSLICGEGSKSVSNSRSDEGQDAPGTLIVSILDLSPSCLKNRT